MSRRASTRERSAPAGVDPRIAARRQSVETARRSRRRRLVATVVALVVVVVGAWFVTRTALLDVDRVEAEGSAHVTPDDVVAASGVRPGDQLLDIDDDAVAQQIGQLPWVDTVTVERSLGGVVSLTVTERTPVAAIAGPESTKLLVDATGRVLGPAEDAAPGIMAVEGIAPADPGQTIEGADGALTLLTALPPGVRSRTTAVLVEPDGILGLALAPQGVALIGPPTRLDEKVASLTTVMGQVDQRGLAGISVIDPKTPTVQRTPG